LGRDPENDVDEFICRNCERLILPAAARSVADTLRRLRHRDESATAGNVAGEPQSRSSSRAG
jgi:hypothetical protein